MKPFQKSVLFLMAMMSIITPMTRWQSVSVYAQASDDENLSEANFTNKIYIPLVIMQQQVDDTGVFQVFKLASESESDTPIEDVQAAGVCIRTPFGPGWVNWTMSKPGQSGYKYSVKPETSNSLIWAQAPSQGIDGIYKASWGSCKAFKVPDSCTVTVHANGTLESCCNAAAALAGHVTKWTNTCSSSSSEAGWPDNPLQ